MEEQKEAEIKIDKLEKENHDLRIKAMDVAKYKTWSWQQILQWILSVDNSRFSKYEKQLKQSLHDEKPNGEDLGYVNEGDIKRWGVSNFRDIKILSQKIKELVNEKNNNNKNDLNVNVEDHEGAISAEYYR